MERQLTWREREDLSLNRNLRYENRKKLGVGIALLALSGLCLVVGGIVKIAEQVTHLQLSVGSLSAGDTLMIGSAAVAGIGWSQIQEWRALPGAEAQQRQPETHQQRVLQAGTERHPG